MPQIKLELKKYGYIEPKGYRSKADLVEDFVKLVSEKEARFKPKKRKRSDMSDSEEQSSKE
jgi:hypothetical protein